MWICKEIKEFIKIKSNMCGYNVSDQSGSEEELEV